MEMTSSFTLVIIVILILWGIWRFGIRTTGDILCLRPSDIIVPSILGFYLYFCVYFYNLEKKDIYDHIIAVFSKDTIVSSTTVMLLFCGALIVGYRYIERRSRKTWWSPGNGLRSEAPMEWIDVITVASSHQDHDPVTRVNRALYKRISLLEILGYIFVSVYCGMFFAFLIRMGLPGEGFKQHPELLAAIAPIGILTSILAGVFAYNNLAAKTRADSRQSWMNTVRTLMASLIRRAGDHLMIKSLKGEDLEKFSNDCLSLELHLNPSEKDHRLLMYLIRSCVYSNGSILYDGNLRKELNSWFAYVRAKCDINNPDNEYYRDLCLVRIISQNSVPACSLNAVNTNDCELYLNNECTNSCIKLPESKSNLCNYHHNKSYEQCCENAISYMVNLSLSILKREWERVRQIE